MKWYHGLILFFLYQKFPASGGELMAYVQALIQAKGHKSHCHQYDCSTPQPLKRADFLMLIVYGEMI